MESIFEQGQNNNQPNPYEKLYGRAITMEQTREARFNLGGYLKSLIEMDQANKAKHKQKERNVNEQNNGSRNNPN